MPSLQKLAKTAVRTATKWSYDGKFVFQGRIYDMKVRDDGQGAVVYQKSPKCLFVKDGDEWLFQAGSKAIFDAAMNHLKQNAAGRTATDPDDMRLQQGPAFHLKSDGTWGVENVPLSVTQDARFSGFLAIEGYWCVVFELGGEEWAQKAAGELPTDSPMAKLSTIARRIAGDMRHIGPGSYLHDEEYMKRVEEMREYLEQRIPHSEKLQALADADPTGDTMWDKWDFSFSAESNYDDWLRHGDLFFTRNDYPAQIRAAWAAPFSAYVSVPGDGFAVFTGESEQEVIDAVSGVEPTPFDAEGIGKSKAVQKMTEPETPRLKLVTSRVLEKIASRIARTRTASFYGIEVEEFNLVEYSDDPTDNTYPYGIIAGEFVFRMPSGKVIRIRGRSDSQNQGFNVVVDGKPFVVDQSTAPDGMIHFHDLDPDWPDDGLQVDDLIHEIAQSQQTS